MKTKITLRTKITLTIAGLFALTGIFCAASPTQFGPVVSNGVIGVAASQSDLLVTEFSSQNLDAIDCSGKISLLATIPGPTGSSLEKYIAIAPSQAANAGFTPRDVFVTQGSNVYKVGSATPFATIQGCGDDHTGITFDHVGTFGYNMIVTCRDGGVFSVGSTGTPAHIADVNAGEIEGPAIPPLSFGPLGGQILVADEDFGQVHAISTTGNVTYGVFSWDGAEGVVVIPSNPCTYCSGGSAFFQVIEDLNAINQYPLTDFTDFTGNSSILVTSESGHGTAVITFNGPGPTPYNQTTFSNIAGANIEGSAFADCDVPPPPATPTPPPPPPPAATNLAVAAATGTYGGTTTLTATLTSASGNTPPVPGKTITFTLNGNSVGPATTDANGVATLSNVSLSGINAGPYPSGVYASFAGDSSFGASNGTNSLTVDPALLTVSADSKSRTYGSPNPMLTASYTGFVNGENLTTSGVTGQPTLSTDATQFSPAGTYTIYIAQGTLAANNYTFTPVNGKLTVYLCGGIIGLNSITIGASSAIVDSYTSPIYPSSPTNQALLLSNGTITLQGAKVYGEMVSTVGKVVLQANSLVTGAVLYATTLSNSGTLQTQPTHQTSTPFVEPIPGACGSYTAGPTTWITGAYTYDAVKGNLTVSGGGTATLAGGTYCFNNVTVSGGSTLVINGQTGPVKISVTGKFVDSGGSLQNTSQIPANLQVTSSYTGSNGVTVSGSSATYLSIYAPGTDVTVSGGGPLYGSLVGKTLTVSGNSAIHEDLGLCSQ
jgi:hypothetical protein